MVTNIKIEHNRAAALQAFWCALGFIFVLFLVLVSCKALDVHVPAAVVGLLLSCFFFFFLFIGMGLIYVNEKIIRKLRRTFGFLKPEILHKNSTPPSIFWQPSTPPPRLFPL
ncbi:MAG: hypothetical protein EPO06_08710 [Burkholderiaceae bacterium]|nr:MAG: hypothetical protein EPO06_08710 [Burkholderiaceae bacterium]